MAFLDSGAILSNYSYDRQLSKLKQASTVPPSPKKDEKLYEVCVEFESIFIKQMLNVMRKNVVKNGFIHGGQAEEIFEDMLYDEYALLMAKKSGFGLADMVYRQLVPQDSGLLSS